MWLKFSLNFSFTVRLHGCTEVTHLQLKTGAVTQHSASAVHIAKIRSMEHVLWSTKHSWEELWLFEIGACWKRQTPLMHTPSKLIIQLTWQSFFFPFLPFWTVLKQQLILFFSPHQPEFQSCSECAQSQDKKKKHPPYHTTKTNYFTSPKYLLRA